MFDETVKDLLLKNVPFWGGILIITCVLILIGAYYG
jgi:hypothetical protein